MARWKLLSGIHSDKIAKPVTLVKLEGEKRQPNVFYPGDVFDSDKSLSRHNVYGSNKQPVSVRFARVEGVPAVLEADTIEQQPDDKLATMTLAELREVAASEEIELGDTKRKDEVLTIIRKATSAVGA